MKTFNEFDKTKTVAIYLDMDGCFADFAKGAYKAFEHFHHIHGVYHDSKQSDKQRKLRKEFIQDIIDTPNFWKNLEWERGGKEVFKFVKDNFDNDLTSVLTAPIDQDLKRCKAEKWEWVQKNFKFIPKNRFFVDHAKHKYVGKVKADIQILIDDRKDNITKWEQSGGYGILHDSKNYQNTIKSLKLFL